MPLTRITTQFISYPVSGSVANTSSWANNVNYTDVRNINSSSSFAGTASYAITSSYSTKSETLLSGANINAGQITASAISVTTLNVVTITSSIDYASGSNIFGTKSTDTQQFTGSVSITGSLTVNGPITGTSSYSTIAGTASYSALAQTASYIANAVSASYALTASYASNVPATSSWSIQAQTASYVANAISSSYALTASYAANVPASSSWSVQAQTASYVINAISASYSGTASYALNGGGTSLVTGSTYNITSSWAVNSSTASYALNGGGTSLITGSTYNITSSWALNAVTSSYALYALNAGSSGTASLLTAQTFAVSGSSETIFTLIQPVADVDQVLVTVSGILQSRSGSYTVSASTLTFSAVVPSGSLVDVRFLNAAGLAGPAVSSSYAATASLTTNLVGAANRIPYQSATNTTSTSTNLTWNGSVLNVGGSVQVPYNGKIQSSLDPTNNITMHDGALGKIIIRTGDVDKIVVNRNVNGGSIQISGSVEVIDGTITGSLLGTSSYALKAESASYSAFAQTASYVTLAQSASYVLNAVSASYSTTASYALNAISASYAPNTYVLPSNVVSASAQLSNGGGTAFTNSNNITVGQVTASAISVTTLSVVTITSSIDYASGSNIFGTKSTDTQLFTGSVSMSGSLSVVGTLNTSGTITSTATNDIFSSTAATTTEKFSRFNNTGGATKWGTESSVGGTIFLGTTAYASVFGSALNNPVQIASNNSVVATVSSTGLAVTGTLGASGLSTLSSGVAVRGNTAPASGVGLELVWDGTQSVVQSYNRTSPAYQPLWLEAGTLVRIGLGGSQVAGFSSTGLTITSTVPTAVQLTRSSTAGSQLMLGNSYAPTVGVIYSSAEAFLTSNAYQTTDSSDAWAKGNSTYSSNAIMLGMSTNNTSYAFKITRSPANTASGTLSNFFTQTLLTVGENGNVGIGTASPAYKLDVSGTIADAIGDIRILPQNSQSAAYTTVLSDSGKHILHPSADTTARTFTIDSNTNVAYPIGTAITFVNQNGAGVVTISITSDTMRLAGAGTTGNRTLAANGVATAVKITSTEWIISGTGLT